ncbi:MAG: hypothetical protein JSC085_000207 [Candidatus Tokpelaia sp. JSC085]|nr:MAG: hypothetical protein JSC085_000207 [Candidatus Tokpelaia sp. JSC085]
MLMLFRERGYKRHKNLLTAECAVSFLSDKYLDKIYHSMEVYHVRVALHKRDGYRGRGEVSPLEVRSGGRVATPPSTKKIAGSTTTNKRQEEKKCGYIVF